MMRKIIVLALLAFIGVRHCHAQTVSASEAAAAANNFMGYVTGSNVGRVDPKVLQTTITKTYNNHNSYYVHKFEPTGYVIMSSTTEYEPVLVYSPDQVYDETNLNPDLVWWMDAYEYEIDSIITNNVQTTEFDSAWQAVSSPSGRVSKTGKILLTSNWGQSGTYTPPGGVSMPTYNALVNDGGHGTSCTGKKCPTGCVATAMAQVMRYWGYPIGREYSYDWCNMPDDLRHSPSSVQVGAVAALMRDIGDKVEMSYCDGGCSSGATAVHAEATFHNYNYEGELIFRLGAGRIGKNWREMLRDEIAHNRPVVYGGRSGAFDGSGHMWVIDGVDPNSSYRFHFNWGWHGEKNGYYYIIDGNKYNQWMHAIFGVKPAEIVDCSQTLDLGTYIGQLPTDRRRYFPKPSGTVLSADASKDVSYRTINSGTFATYTACRQIVLRPGFKAASGSTFIANIMDCFASRIDGWWGRKDTHDEMESPEQEEIVQDENTISVYPNPSKGTVKISAPENVKISRVQILNLRGEKVAQVEVNNQSYVEMNISHFSNDVYLVRIQCDQQVITKKIVLLKQ
jgi:hypothetical protein